MLAGELKAVLGERRATLAENLVQFGRVLKTADFDVASGRVIDAARSLALIDLGNRDDFRTALRCNLVSHVEDFPLFDLLFDTYWRSDRRADRDVLPRTRWSEGGQPRRPGRNTGRNLPIHSSTAHEPDSDNPAGTYSDAHLLTVKDFSTFTDEDVRRARRVIQQMAPKLATALSRRTRVSRRGGPVDLRRSLRRSIKHGGEVLELYRQRRRVTDLRVVMLCDVSGSMDVYSRFLVQFLYAMQTKLRHVSTFVFSTRLNEVTHLLKTRSYDQALAQIRAEVDSWSGGTSIGASLYTFDRRYGKTRLSGRTVVIIISDGWDRGDTTLIGKAMSSIKRRSHKIIWLNPLLGGRDYQPVAKGMAAALPYIDYFLPVHNLASLVRIARTLVYLAKR